METIKRAFDTNNVAVLLTSSDLYAPYAGVVVESIIENSSDDNNYDIIIFNDDIMQDHKNKLVKTVENKSNFSLRIYDVSEVLENYDFKKNKSRYNKYTMFRLAAPQVLTEYDKVIYLDTDIIVLADLAELYNIDLADNYLAAARCLGMSITSQSDTVREDIGMLVEDYLRDELKLEKLEDYFNAGVILLNLQKFRDDFEAFYLLDEANKRNFLWCDQDVLNTACYGHVLFLPLKWNTFIKKGDEHLARPELYNEWVEAKKSPNILHFVGGEECMPVNNPIIDGYDLFWKYAIKTKFKEELLARLDKEIDTKVKTVIHVQKTRAALAAASAQPQDGATNSGNWFKRTFKQFIPYGSPKYIAAKKIYFKLRKRPYFPVVDISNSKTLQKNEQRIKIFVSRRIDIDSYIVNNPIFQDVRCGAFYDNKPSLYLGDNTGDNISDLRIPFCEMTVMYWAWKNEDADYFGLCHYRRYPSFHADPSLINDRGVINLPNLDDKTIKKYKLDDKALYEKMIPQADIWITSKTYIVNSTFLPVKGNKILDLFMTNFTLYDPSLPIITLEIIDEFYPEYSKAAHDYLNQDFYYSYNCFIMKKELFNTMCEFFFGVLFKIHERYDFSLCYGNKQRSPAYMSEMLYGVFIVWATQKGYNIKQTPLLFFEDTVLKPPSSKAAQAQAKAHKKLMKKSQQYRVLIDTDRRIKAIHGILTKSSDAQGVLQLKKTSADRTTLTDNSIFSVACFAEQVHTYHKAAFAEFKNCHTNRSVAIIATGPTMKYYSQISNIPHIGMNASFMNPNIKLDFYFTTDYSTQPEWFKELKNYDFIKFFGQYSTGGMQSRFQVSEDIITENNGRRFFQGAPSPEINIDIEFYPLIGYYTIALQAIQFAIYTNPRRIYLIGCDCNQKGYFDGSKQSGTSSVDVWLQGYKKLKDFVTRFYPSLEIISVNPCGLKGMFRDVYTEEYLNDHPEINREYCEIVDLNTIEEEMEKNI